MNSRHSRVTLRVAVLASIAVLGAIACGKNTPIGPPPPAPPPPPPPPPPPGAGTLTVRLTTPNTDDGAILLELRGPNIHALAVSNSAWQVYADSSGTPIRSVVAGNLTTGGLVTFQVPDVGAVASYTATIVDVSDRQNRLRSALTGYTLVIAP